MILRTTLATFSLCSLYSLCATLGAGCYAPPPNSSVACEEGSLCDNGQLCTNGACDTPLPDAPLPVDACATATCAGDQLVGCGQPEVCALGCTVDVNGSSAHCLELKPSNGFNDWAITVGTSSLTVNSQLVADTETGEISQGMGSGRIVVRSAGVGLRDGIYFATLSGAPSVFAMHDLTIVNGGALRVIGAPAAVLLVDGNAVIAGRLDASAGLDPLRPVGPGGGSGGATIAAAGGGCGGGIFGTSSGTSDGGGGGGGMRDAGGGGGGSNAMPQLGGAAGASCSITDLQPLRGGSGGGTGGAGLAMVSFGWGGHGGGALQLSARNQVVLENSGVIVASGGGGGGGQFINASGGGGGGGGAGGGILIEAQVVVVIGAMFANSNNNGGGADISTAGGNGAFGQESMQPAQGGSSGGGARGGDGGTNIQARDGRVGNNGGGGGGSAGVIVVRSRDAMLAGPASPMVRRLPMLTQ